DSDRKERCGGRMAPTVLPPQPSNAGDLYVLERDARSDLRFSADAVIRREYTASRVMCLDVIRVERLAIDRKIGRVLCSVLLRDPRRAPGGGHVAGRFL